MFGFFLVILAAICLALVVAVLLQAGTGGGLAAMGGGSSSDTVFGGRQATTILTRGTWWLGGIFLGLALVMAGMSAKASTPRSVLESQPTAPMPVIPSAPQLFDEAQPPPEGGAVEGTPQPVPQN
ncbi:MAG TPA: preprotein translocase subunit SecG [Gemmatimonadales bacterium]|jgi:preprotein translocase subunit SecG